MQDVAAAHSDLGKALLDLNRLEDALASYDRAIALKPDYAGAYINRGNALQDLDALRGRAGELRQGNRAEARQCKGV